MPRGYRHLQVGFSGGELAPQMWSRHDDARYRFGAARLRNMISHPRGSVARRPGFQFVREVKDSTRRVRLLPFRFSAEQTHVIEMGRAVVDGRDIGYFRFHTEGATLLQQRPRNYVAPKSATAIDHNTEEWDIGAHDFETGDPIIFTMDTDPTTSPHIVTFDPDTNEVLLTAHGFRVNDEVLFRQDAGSLPPELNTGDIYYVATIPPADRFRLAKKVGGQIIDFSTAGSGTVTVACLPRPAGIQLMANHTYYAVRRSGTTIAVASTRANALAGVVFDFVASGKGTVANGDCRVHYDYRPGSVVFDDPGALGGSPFYCRKTPWGVLDARVIYPNDHLDHPTSNLIYWVRQPGSSEVVTFDLIDDRVDWMAHGLDNGDPVIFTTTGTLPTEIVAGAVYYVRNKTTDDFQVAASVPGPVLGLSGVPAGVHTAFANGIYEVPHYYSEETLFEVNFAQSNDVLTLVHFDRPIAELTRLGPTHWTLSRVGFNNAIAAPTGVEASVNTGEGLLIVSVSAANPALLTTTTSHTLTEGESVMVVNTVDIPDGEYVVNTVDFPAPVSGTGNLTLKSVNAGVTIGSAGGAVSSAARIRSTDFTVDWFESYVVTALNADGEESPPSAVVTVGNNLLVAGSYNTISWEPVAGASRYRVYKGSNGLPGFIGETVASSTSFVDDNIGPDLSISFPILDRSLRVSAFVTFDTTQATVVWPAHGLETGAPVLLETDGVLPTGLEYGTIYYVVNPTTDNFQLTATPTGTVEISFTGPESGVHQAFSGFFPSAVCYFEQRRVFGGARLRPQDFWLTASGTETDLSYSLPTQASDRIHNRLAATELSAIRHAVPVGHLFLPTSAAEYRLTPINGESLVPGGVAARAPTHVGSSTVAPVLVNSVVLFAAARGGHIREMVFVDQAGDYVTGDMSLRASHLFDNLDIVQMALQKAPHQIVWAVSTTGQLLGFTYIPEEQVAGWHTHDIAGSIESVAVVSEGTEDRVYIVANRSGVRTVERMGCQCIESIEDVFYVDLGITYDGSAVSSIFVPHLASRAVVYLADGVVGSGTVSSAGVLTLTTPASTVHVGLDYLGELRTLPLGLQLDAALGSGRTKNVNKAWVRVSQSGAFDVGPALDALSTSPAPPTGQLLTELVPVIVLGEWNEEGQIHIQQDGPLPLTVVGLTLEVATGG